MNTKNKPTNQNTNNKKTLGKVIMIHKGYSKYLEHNIAITSKHFHDSSVQCCKFVLLLCSDVSLADLPLSS